MEKVVLEIAGLAISFESRHLVLERSLLPFASRRRPQLRVRCSPSSPPRFQKKTLFYRRGKTYQFYRTQEGFLIEIDSYALKDEFKETYLHPLSDGMLRAILIDNSLKQTTFFLGPGKKGGSFYLIWPYVYLLISHLLLSERSGLFIHAAGMCDGGSGFLFVGDSGAGKSTLARLFRQEGNTSVLGDDSMVIRKEKRRPHIYGTPLLRILPPSLLTEGAPLEAIFFLTHGRRTRLIHLSPRESLRRIIKDGRSRGRHKAR